MDISKASIIITGAGGDLGRALIDYFLEVAKHVYAVDVKSDRIKDKFKDRDHLSVLDCNLTDPDAIASSFKEIADITDIHTPNVLVNNAGLIHSELMFDLFNSEEKSHNIEAWNTVLSANLDTTFKMSRYFIEQFGSRRKGSVIINISSVSARGMTGQTAYAAAKAGVEAMTKTWSKELAGLKIRSNAIAPGFIETNSTKSSLSESKIKEYKRHTPSGRLGNSNEFCKAVEHLIENDFINGHILSLDGGFNIL